MHKLLRVCTCLSERVFVYERVCRCVCHYLCLCVYASIIECVPTAPVHKAFIREFHFPGNACQTFLFFLSCIKYHHKLLMKATIIFSSLTIQILVRLLMATSALWCVHEQPGSGRGPTSKWENTPVVGTFCGER